MINFNKRYKTNFKLLKFFVIPWFLLFLCLSYAFSGFTDTLKATSLATIQEYINDYVYITNVRVSEISNASSLYNVHLSNETKTATNASACNSYVTYAVDIINSTSSKAFITKTSVESILNQNGTNTTGFDVSVLDVVNNVTYINPHETKTIRVKVKNNCSTSDSQAVVRTSFEYSLYPYHNLTITATPSSASISMTTSEGTFTGTGSLTHLVYETDSVSYSVSNSGYESSSGTYKMSTSNHTINVTLQPDTSRTLAIIPNVPGQNCHCLVNGVTAFYTEDYSQATATVHLGDDVSCSVGMNNEINEYYNWYDAGSNSYNGYYTRFTVEDNVVLRPEFLLKPYMSGTYTNTNNKVASNNTLTNYHPGYYLFELWGGDGGNGYNYSKDKGGIGGTCGYVYGIAYLDYGQQISYSLGGDGNKGESSGNETPGGANGGGLGNYNDRNVSYIGGSGGGYSSLQSNGSYLLVAAGGGGAGGPGGIAGGKKGGNGGAGGNIGSAATSISGGVVFSGNDGDTSRGGTAGTTTGGSNKYESSSNYYGSAFQGGKSYNRGGGGGAGWLGGGGGTSVSSQSHDPTGGGGGGSSYIASSVIYTNLSSTTSTNLKGIGSNPSSSGGALVITFLGTSIP